MDQSTCRLTSDSSDQTWISPLSTSLPIALEHPAACQALSNCSSTYSTRRADLGVMLLQVYRGRVHYFYLYRHKAGCEQWSNEINHVSTSGSLKKCNIWQSREILWVSIKAAWLFHFFTGLANSIASPPISFLFTTSPVVSNIHSLEQKYISDPHVSWLPPLDLELLLQTAITSYHSCQTNTRWARRAIHWPSQLLWQSGVFSSISQQAIWPEQTWMSIPPCLQHQWAVHPII